jgi:hypothetical protein
MVNETAETREDGTIVDISLPNSMEMDVGHDVDKEATAHCRVCGAGVIDTGAFFVEVSVQMT